MKNKEQQKRIVKRLLVQAAILMLQLVVMSTPVFASAEDALSGLIRFRDFLSSLITMIGSFFLLWGFFEFATSLMGNDGIMQTTAFRKIAAGLICCYVPSLYTLIRG